MKPEVPGGPTSREDELREIAAAGLCATCVHVRRVRSGRGSTFYRCGRADEDAAFTRYPRLPVARCRGHERP